MTRDIMHYLIILITSVFMFFLLANCQVDNSTDKTKIPDSGISQKIPGSGVSQKVGPVVSYQLPSGWEFSQDEPLKARLLDPAKKPDMPPDMVLEIIPVQSGTEDDAKNMALDLFKQEQENNPESNVIFFEIDLGGEKLYVLEQETEAYWGLPYWYTSAYLEKEGHIINIILFDRIQNQMEALDIAVKTLEWNKG